MRGESLREGRIFRGGRRVWGVFKGRMWELRENIWVREEGVGRISRGVGVCGGKISVDSV